MRRPVPRVAVFAFDLDEPSQRRGIRAIRATGAIVETYSFRRGNAAPGPAPDWADVPLGAAPNGTGPARIAAILRAALRVIRHRRRLAGAEVIVARNLDLALLALLALRVSGGRARLIYQCLDIHGVMTSATPLGRAARWAERRVLAHCARLVVSAPRFLDAHFRSVQGYRGDALVLENRVGWTGPAPARRVAREGSGPGPIRLGWVGTLRCPATLALLAETADAMGVGLHVHLRGIVHRHQLPRFDAVLAARGNMTYEGPYAYPDGLAGAYAGLDAVWAQDMWQTGGNSDWLLPNRIYEAGYFGCPAIAVRGTATAERVGRDGLGLVLPDATAAALQAALDARGVAGLWRIRRHVLTLPAAAFSAPPGEAAAMLDLGPALDGFRDCAA